LNEKGSIRSGKTGQSRRTQSGGSERTLRNLNSPALRSPVSPIPAAGGNAWRPQRPPRPEMVPSQSSSTFRRLLYDVGSEPF
jgi:hypothetical protein